MLVFIILQLHNGIFAFFKKALSAVSSILKDLVDHYKEWDRASKSQ